MPEIDKITLDIIENALRSTRDEMDAVLFRSAMSPVIREQHDGFPMVCHPDGRMVVGQFGSYISGFIKTWKRGINEGDVFLISDPYSCGGAISHINDWLVLLPIFYHGELVGWSSQFGHTVDIGGSVSGSMPTDATTIFGEGTRIPPVKLYDGGKLNEDLLDLILANSRVPTMNYFDLMAIVAACRTADKRVKELCDRFGKETYLNALEALLRRTYDAMAQLIVQNLPESPLEFEDYVDDDGRGNGPYKMRLKIYRKGNEAYFDWSGTDPQAPGPINFYLNEEMFKMFIGVYLIMVFDPQILFNDGFYPLLHIEIPEGSLLQPKFPAALGCRTHALARLF
ncbi:MAG: hydantoinase B/oxoprolinase family protein, partial [Acidobacteriota bacterium]|nr:hydantoinase B/oxoprolinase family protein [Acidobacteriota bacterium]